MMIAIDTLERRGQSTRALRHCDWNEVGRGTARAAKSQLARSPVICTRAALRIDEKAIRLNAVPICRHKISSAATTQHNVAPHPRPHYSNTKRNHLTLSGMETRFLKLVKFVNGSKT